MMASLSEQLPYWEFTEKPLPHMVLWDGSLSTALELSPIDIECFDETSVNQLTEQLRSFANSLDEGFTVQFMVKIDSSFNKLLIKHKELVSTNTPFLRALDEKRCANLRQETESQSVFQPKLYMFMRTAPPQKPKVFSFKAQRKFSHEFERGYEESVEALSHSLESAEGVLSSLGFMPRRLNREELVSTIYEHINPRRARDVGAPRVTSIDSDNNGETPRSQLALSDLLIDQQDFVLDQERVRVLSLKTRPEMTIAGMMSSFLVLPFKYNLNFTFRVPDQAREMRALESKRRMAHSLTANNGARVSDLEGESRLSQTTNLIREIIESGQRIFYAELVITLREENTKEGLRRLNLNSKEVLSAFKLLTGAEGMQETFGSWPVFSNSLPGSPIRLIREKPYKTNNLVDLLPLYGARVGDEKPVVITHTRRGSLCSINPYDSSLTNYNMLVTGSSGSGKSFANNFMLLQQIARGTRVYVIDVGGSYKKLTELLGGQYFELNLSGKYVMNPFNVVDPTVPPTGEKIKGLVDIIEQMVVDHGERLSKMERVQIEEALAKVFELARNENPSRSPQLTDFAKYCKQSPEPELKRISKLLYPWIGETPFGRILDRPGQISADSPIVAFDLKGLSQHPDLQSVMVLTLTNFILDQVEGDRTINKRVLLDEAWSLLKSPAASSFMEYAARTFRKTGSGITFITQGVEEIVQSPIGSAILNNTATKLIMLQRGHTGISAETIKGNPQELRLIQSLEQRKGLYSEGFFIEGDSRRVLRFAPSPLEYWVSTSDASDNVFLESLRAKSGSIESGVHEAAAAAPFGVANKKVAV